MLLVLTRGLPSSTCGHEFFFPQLMDDPKVFPSFPRTPYPQGNLGLFASAANCQGHPQPKKILLPWLP